MLDKPFSPGPVSKIIGSLDHIANNFPINDPTTPELVSEVGLPSVGKLSYAVQGLSMEPKNANENRALNCHFHIGHCLNTAQRMMQKPLHSWAATRLLQVFPAAGSDMNAYYDRRSLKFFYYNFKGKNVYFGDSSDIITHELGHAILDAMRPDFWSVQALEIWSFHEAFSDITAVFNFLNHNRGIKAVLDETGGNLRVSNHASRLAEEIGKLIRDVTGDGSYLSNALRDLAVEKFHYSKPSSLPKSCPNNQLAAECHSFGRVFSAAWYEALVRAYEYECSTGKTPEIALKVARDACFSIILKAIPISPRTSDYYEAVARCMVGVASYCGEEYPKIFSEVFTEWNIISQEPAKILSSVSWHDVALKLERGDQVVKTRSGAFVCMKTPESVKVSDLPLISGLSLPSDFEVSITSDNFYEFDKYGNLVGEIKSDKNRSLADAAECMSYVSNELGADGMWEIKDGKLERRFVR